MRYVVTCECEASEIRVNKTNVVASGWIPGLFDRERGNKKWWSKEAS
jgi:hypothetical protein